MDLRWQRKEIDRGKEDKSSDATLRNRTKQRNRARNKKLKEKQAERLVLENIAFDRNSRAKDNLKLYQSWSMREKIYFARHGYIFDNFPGEPAIVISETTIRTPEGMERCVKAGRSLPYLPIEFLILFSWSEISDSEAVGLQSYYQLALPYDLVLYMHTEPSTDHGLANFINAAVSAPSRSSLEYLSKVREVTEQNMTVKNCKFVNRTHSLNPVFRAANPAYVLVAKKVPPGYELLLPKNYGNKKKVF